MQERKKISHLTHRNSVQKTIRMQLNPVGKTMDYFQAKQILENDEKLKENYQKIDYLKPYHIPEYEPSYQD